MDKSKEEQSLEYWSGRSAEFSALHMNSYNSAKRLTFAEQIAMSMPACDEVNALDLGCGSGFMSLLLLDAGCKVTGIDFSDDMLAFARENIASRGYEAEFLHMRAQKLEFPDNSFDFIVSRNVTWTLEDVDVVYAEVMRVLKDGGVFLNLDANYGRVFNELDRRGIPPSHPTQTPEQLRMRNDIAHDLQITLVDRPQWDMGQFWNLGADEVRCRLVGETDNGAGTLMFALEVHNKAVLASPAHVARIDRSVDSWHVGVFEFDPRKFVVKKNGTPISLTPKEFNILVTLANNAGKTLSQAELVESAWGKEYINDTSGLAVYIRRIRKKIEDDSSNPRYLLTSWGSGYRFDPAGTPA